MNWRSARARKREDLSADLFPGQAAQPRDRLERKYHHLLIEKLDYRPLVTYVPNKKIPVYNWFKYKEGFSRQLVFNLLNHWKLPKTRYILDPFAGCGTTLLACKELEYPAVGMDILPIAVYVAKVKLQDWPDLDELSQAVDELMRRSWKTPRLKFPEVKIIPLAFSEETQKQILFFKEQILSFEKPVQDFLVLGLLSILESVSKTSKDGQFLRLVEREIPPVKDVLRQQLSVLVQREMEHPRFC